MAKKAKISINYYARIERDEDLQNRDRLREHFDMAARGEVMFWTKTIGGAALVAEGLFWLFFIRFTNITKEQLGVSFLFMLLIIGLLLYAGFTTMRDAND